jgi:hypothetical protein
MSQGAIGAVGGGDVVGTITTGVATNTSLSSFALSGGTTKQLPTGAIIGTIPAAGTASAVQAWYTTGLTASGVTTVNVGAQTTRTVGGAINNGDQMVLLSFAPYIMLTTSTPTGSALGTEYTATGYARQPIVWTAPTAADPPNAVSNGTITFGPTSSSPGTTITCGELMDAITGGTAVNAYAFWTFATSRTPQSGDSIQIASAALSLSDE